MSKEIRDSKYWDKYLESLYQKHKFPLLKLDLNILATELNISPDYLKRLFSQRKYSIRDEYLQFTKTYDPKKYTLRQAMNLANIKANIASFRRYIRENFNISYLSTYKLIRTNIQQDLKEMYEEYDYPILNKGYDWIANYLGYTPKSVRKVLNQNGYTEDYEYRLLLKNYSPKYWTCKEISQIVNKSYKTICYRIKKYYKKTKIKITKKRMYSVSELNKNREKFGEINELKKSNMFEFYVYVISEFNKKGYITVKEGKLQGIKRVGVYMWSYKKKYNLKYTYNHTTATYYKIEGEEYNVQTGNYKYSD